MFMGVHGVHGVHGGTWSTRGYVEYAGESSEKALLPSNCVTIIRSSPRRHK